LRRSRPSQRCSSGRAPAEDLLEARELEEELAACHDGMQLYRPLQRASSTALMMCCRPAQAAGRGIAMATGRDCGLRPVHRRAASRCWPRWPARSHASSTASRPPEAAWWQRSSNARGRELATDGLGFEFLNSLSDTENIGFFELWRGQVRELSRCYSGGSPRAAAAGLSLELGADCDGGRCRRAVEARAAVRR
uniref:Alpha-type protein kinase domain-containing protein n=1 Tax=Macrostomum lignano TaxID=282301 RepID=A0A1I8FHD0_9PLAT